MQQASSVATDAKSSKPKRGNLAADAIAGITTALVTIPDGMASAILAGVSPLSGLYALMVGTPIAALLSSSQFMYVANTGALAVAVGSALQGTAADQLLAALAALTLLVGLFQLAFGLLKLGGLLRFVSNAVLTGFMTGIGINIILGQLGDFTGFESTQSNKVLQALDLLTHLNQVQVQTLLVGAGTLAAILLLDRTRLRKFNMILAIGLASLAVLLLNWESSVGRIGDIADIQRSFPSPALPDLALIPGLLLPALSVAIIGLVQAAGVSKSVPNPDGNYPDVSRDFVGQGAGNIASGLFRGMPIGGTMSETSVNLNAGAESRWANILSAVFIIAIVLLLGNLVELIPLPAIAALLIVAGYEAIKFDAVRDVWDIGLEPRILMLITLIATLVIPVQWAVLLGVALSIVQYVYRSSLDIQLKALTPLPDGGFEEGPAPKTLAGDSVTVLLPYGSSFYATMSTLEQRLPDPGQAERAVVILNLRGRESFGSTFIKLLERYSAELRAGGGKLMLAGVGERVLDQIERTETTEFIPREDIYVAQPRLGQSTQAALAAARTWLQQKEVI